MGREGHFSSAAKDEVEINRIPRIANPITILNILSAFIFFSLLEEI
jgi:hypothetical protein